LQPGIHIAYAYADLEDIVFANQQSQAPLMSSITGYAFLVAPPSTGLSPTSLSFGLHAVNTTSPAQTVTLTSANGPLDIGGISVSGHFLESDNCPAQLAAGASCTISVMFAPVSGDQGNTVTGAVTITDDNNGVAGNTDTIALTGTGSSPATASLSPNTLTFSSQAVGTTSSPAQTVTLSNTGTLALTVNSVTASGDFAITNNTCTTVAVSANCMFGVTFTPTAAGTRSGAVTVTDSTGTQVVALTGTGSSAGVSLSPTSLTFSSQVGGTTSSPARTVTLSNTGTLALTVSSVAASGDFAIANNTCTSVAATSTCTFGVTFTPTAAGTRTCAVTVMGSAGTQTVALSGTAQPLTLTNTGTAALSISGIAFAGANSGDFSQTNNCGTSLPAGENCTIGVTFTPSNMGNRVAILTVTDGAASSPQSVALNGVGLASATTSQVYAWLPILLCLQPRMCSKG
jgi:hypothetical protein